MKIQRYRNGLKARRAGGFSLIEVSVAMGVIGIACVALYSGLTSGLATVRMSRENDRATQIMTEKLDTIRLYSWDKIISASYIPTNFTKAYSPTNGGLGYFGTVRINPVNLPAAYSNNVRQVTVSLNWTNGTLRRQRSMTTYVAKDGMQNYIY